MSVTVVEDNTDEWLRQFHSAIEVAMEEVGMVAEGYAKILCPVDTGRLRNSITHGMVDDHTVAIGTNVEYGPHVELGTVRQKAQPYLRPAAGNHKSEYRAILKKHLGK